MSSLLQDLRYGWRTLGQDSGIRHRRDPDAGARHRRQHRDLQLRRRRPAQAAAVQGRRPDRSRHREASARRAQRHLHTEFSRLAERQRRSSTSWPRKAGGAATLTGTGDPVQLRGARVSAHYFDIFGIQAERGRTFLRRRRSARQRIASSVLSHALWVNQFGADPSILNRTILLDNEPHTVVGVLPAGSAFDRAFNQLWRPLAFEPSNMTRNFHWLTSFARLKQGVSLQQAQANMNAIGARIEQDFPDSNKGLGRRHRTLRRHAGRPANCEPRSSC